jgi:hypothetical protein
MFLYAQPSSVNEIYEHHQNTTLGAIYSGSYSVISITHFSHTQSIAAAALIQYKHQYYINVTKFKLRIIYHHGSKGL